MLLLHVQARTCLLLYYGNAHQFLAEKWSGKNRTNLTGSYAYVLSISSQSLEHLT